MKKTTLISISCLLLFSGCTKKDVEAIPTTTPVISLVNLPIPNAEAETSIEFETTWSLATTDGNATQQAQHSNQTIQISHPGTSLSGVYLYHDGIPFTDKVPYQFQFNASSTFSRNIEVVFSNADTNEILFQQTVALIPELTQQVLSFTYQGPSIWNGRITFNLGAVNSEIDLQSQEIQLQNINLLETENSQSVPKIKVNQVGYLPNSYKRIIFPYDQGDLFYVIDVTTGQNVYTSAILGKRVNESSKETTFYGDFSEFTTPGVYRIQSQIVGTSYEFEIKENIYQQVVDDAVRMLTLQRCGSAVLLTTAPTLSHEQCHTLAATVYGTDQQIDVRGGWHDAGDYGRYVTTGVKAVSDLLLAYQVNPSAFGDNLGIPESGNSIPDILDEARYELEWLCKMQNSWGGVYDKVVTAQLPGYILPELDQQPLYVMPELSTATGSFAGVMAYASMIYKDIDPDFSSRCLQAAELSWNYLQTMSFNPYENPEGFSAGQYRDDSDIDERFYAAAALYTATQQSKYHDVARSLYTNNNTALSGLDWHQVANFGSYLILTQSPLKTNDNEFYKALLGSFQSEAITLQNAAIHDSYHVSLYNNYIWGSNSHIANQGVLFYLANEITPNQTYKNFAQDHLHYLLGKNSLNLSFVTTTGDTSPQHIHHRIAIAKNTLLPGALVGGANNSLEDPVTQQLFNAETAAAKCYVDDQESYSTNEVAIYWNSSFITLASMILKDQ